MLRPPVPAHGGQMEQAVVAAAEGAVEAEELPLQVQAPELQQERGRGDWH